MQCNKKVHYFTSIIPSASNFLKAQSLLLEVPLPGAGVPVGGCTLQAVCSPMRFLKMHSDCLVSPVAQRILPYMTDWHLCGSTIDRSKNSLQFIQN